jgi:hypothetical protein
MTRFLLGAFVVAHGLVTIAIWSPNPRTVKPSPPMDTSHSWLLGDARTAAIALAISAGLVMAAAGVGFLTHQEWWTVAGVAGGALSLILFALFFTPWWLAGIAISVALLAASFRTGS